MKGIEYRESPPTQQDFFKLFASTGWMQTLKISEADLQKVFENTWYWITAYQGKNIVGAGRLISDGSLYALICDIIVIPDHQNKGIGSIILKQLVKKCQDTQLKRVWYLQHLKKPGSTKNMDFLFAQAKLQECNWENLSFASEV